MLRTVLSIHLRGNRFAFGKKGLITFEIAPNKLGIHGNSEQKPLTHNNFIQRIRWSCSYSAREKQLELIDAINASKRDTPPWTFSFVHFPFLYWISYCPLVQFLLCDDSLTNDKHPSHADNGMWYCINVATINIEHLLIIMNWTNWLMHHSDENV